MGVQTSTIAAGHGGGVPGSILQAGESKAAAPMEIEAAQASGAVFSTTSSAKESTMPHQDQGQVIVPPNPIKVDVPESSTQTEKKIKGQAVL